MSGIAVAPRSIAVSLGVPDLRRGLQIALAAIWLFDGILQYQPYMFTRAFGTQMLAPVARGNPQVVAEPITWAARLIAQHPEPWNAAFTLIQLLLGLGIAYRRTARTALAISILWSFGVWWFGEGLGGILTGQASPVNGAPGAVILYALLAVLVWPAGRRDTDFVAAGWIGAPAARALWLLLWGGLACLCLQRLVRAPQALHNMIGGMAVGEPSWLSFVDRHTASLVAHRGLAVSIVLAVLLALIAMGVLLPVAPARATVVSALVMSAAIWLVGEDLGGLFAGGQATDPASGPLLALVAVAFWPLGSGAGRSRT